MAQCPICGNESPVEPVSVVYAERSADDANDDLAWLLSPPRVEPRFPPHSYQDREENRVLLPAIGLLIVLGLIAAFDGYGFGGFLAVTLPGGLIGLMIAKAYGSARYQSARTAAIAAAAAEELMPAHVQLRERWESALYCHRNEIVFFEDSEDMLTAIEFRNLMTGVKRKELAES